MRSLTKEKLYTEYLICKDLTPNKEYKTYIAMKEHSNGTLYSVILKEVDEKRAVIYEELSGMWNPFLTNVYEAIQLTNEERRYAAITECVYAEGSPEKECLSLTEFIHQNGPLTESASLSVCIQICEGLKEFHKKGFVHRDLKPDNVMISRYDIEHPGIKITDFGGAKWLKPKNNADTTVIGTLGYQPPESLSSNTTRQADIYSIGCILNFMLTGQEPGIQYYKENHYVENIIEKATNEDPSHRYFSVTAMQKALEHELGVSSLDKIPFVRALPGFRTHTLWKEIIGVFAYITMLLLAVICLTSLGGIGTLIEIFTFYIIIPLIVLFNMGNLLRFFPKDLRQNNRLFLMLRTSIILFCIFVPALYDYLIGGSL